MFNYAKYIKLAKDKKEKKMKGEDPCWEGYEMIGEKKFQIVFLRKKISFVE